VPSREGDPVAARRGLFRVGMLAVALPQVAISTWALIAPHSFYRDFPGGGRHWLPPLGSFNGHLINDYGSFTLGLAVGLILAAIWAERRAVQVALAAWLVGAAPHLIWHATNTEAYGTTDNAGTLVGLALYVIVPLGLLVLTRTPRPRAAAASATAKAGEEA
jgi:hypothetical protein